MKKSILSLAAAALMAAPLSQASAPQGVAASGSEQFAKVVKRYAAPKHQWAKGAVSTPAKAKVVRTEADGELPPSSYYGSLFTPEGEEWMYLSEFTYGANNSIEKVSVTIYDANFKVYSSLEFDLELGEGEVAINQVQLVNTLTRKFFNIDSEYEIMVYVHATTPDYTGRNYTKVYSLKDGKHIIDIEGNNIGMVNTAPDKWAENYTMAFMREWYDDENYMWSFDVYGKAGWSGGPELKHTFDINYTYISGSGAAAMPFIMTANGNNEVMYALPSYEKPFFENYDDFFSEPIVNKDNNFVIDLYDQQFNKVKTTKIPMETVSGYLYSFPGIGILQGFEDMTFGQYNDSKDDPVYVVGYENYTAASDSYVCDFHVYDSDGNRLQTIVTDATDYLWLSDIKGHESQFCFYNESKGTFNTIDLPSCQQAASIPITTEEGLRISTAFDRTPYGNSYLYVTSVNSAAVDDDDNALHSIVWLGLDGDTHHRHAINLGQNVALGQPYISAYALKPYLFNTNSEYEYMFFVKEFVDAQQSKTRELFRLYSEKSDKLMEIAPLEDGSFIQTVFLLNPETNPKMGVVFYGTGVGYTMKYFNLPLSKFAGGDGTVENPYLIATPGDLMAIELEPKANYALAADLDFEQYAWSGNDCTFTGTLDGKGHTISNLNIDGRGIFSAVSGSASISNLIIDTSHLYSENGAGFIAGTFMGENAGKYPTISNVRVYNSIITGTGGNFGTIVSAAGVYSQITDCAAQYITIDVEDGFEVSAGGIAGRTQTSASIANCYFEGDIDGGIVGGIVGEAYTNDAIVSNCHVLANITGTTNAGGIYGYAKRVNISNCFVEGEIAATGTDRAYAGGIAGALEPVYEDEKKNLVIIQNNIVAASSITANAEAKSPIAHRIVGFSGLDNTIIDWDNVTDEMESEDYPRIADEPDKGLAGNYAIGLPVIVSSVADDATTPEGKTIDFADLTDELLAAAGWKFGEDSAQPWVKGADRFTLYFEGKDNVSGIESIGAESASAIRFNGSEVAAPGKITVYDLSGVAVAAGTDNVGVAHLAKGVYVAVSANGSLKFAVK